MFRKLSYVIAALTILAWFGPPIWLKIFGVIVFGSMILGGICALLDERRGRRQS